MRNKIELIKNNHYVKNYDDYKIVEVEVGINKDLDDDYQEFIQELDEQQYGTWDESPELLDKLEKGF